MNRKRGAKIWKEIRRWLLLTIGISISALGFSIFQVPYKIAAGGVSGIGLIVNSFVPAITVSAFYFAVNIPLLVFGFFTLGRWRFLAGTVFAVVLWSTAIEIFPRYLAIYASHWPITDNILLSAIYAGLIGGIGDGLIYAAGATLGGTAIIGRSIQIRTGVPLSQIYLFVDGGIVVAAAIFFGWEIALYAMLTLLLAGITSDYVLEGPSRARSATIITTKRDELIPALMAELGRGLTFWEAYGGYTQEKRTIIFCTIYRPQVNELRRIVGEIDPSAFVSIDTTQLAMGEGFIKIIG